MTTAAITDSLQLRARYAITAEVVFETAWRVGSGREGETMSDLGILLDAVGVPVLPGTSLKGKLRSTCEGLAPALNLKACLLNANASGVKCVSDVKEYKKLNAEYRNALERGTAAQLNWIAANTCDVCKLFGSPVQAARLRLSDGLIQNTEAALVEVRDGVVLDRDSHTAVPGLKFDYDVAPAGLTYLVRIDLENPSDSELALVGAALFEWSAGSSLGGFTSRGLGRFHLNSVKIVGVDFSNKEQRRLYLTKPDPRERMTSLGDWQTFFQTRIEQQLERTEEN